MPQIRCWTIEADAAIRGMRLQGETWASIGRSLGLSRNTVIERGRRLQASARSRESIQKIERSALDDPNRSPLPAGHPLTWNLLTEDDYPGYQSFGRL